MIFVILYMLVIFETLEIPDVLNMFDFVVILCGRLASSLALTKGSSSSNVAPSTDVDWNGATEVGGTNSELPASLDTSGGTKSHLKASSSQLAVGPVPSWQIPGERHFFGSLCFVCLGAFIFGMGAKNSQAVEDHK